MHPSNARLKSKVVQLTDVLEKLEQIRGVFSEWNDTMKAKGWRDKATTAAFLLRRWKWYFLSWCPPGAIKSFK